MSKSLKKIDTNQLSIFAYLRSLSERQEDQAATTEGKFKITEDLRAAMRAAIKACPLSRHQIAGEMSHLLGESISKDQIDSWTREDQQIPPAPLYEKGEIVGRDSGRVVRRYIPAEYLPAFCRATGCSEPLAIMGRMAGLFVLPGPEALRAEIQRYDEEGKRARAEKKKRLAFLEFLEGKNNGG